MCIILFRLHQQSVSPCFHLSTDKFDCSFSQSVYGVLNSIEGCQAFEEAKEHTNIGDWYKSMQIAVKSHYGAQAISGTQTFSRDWPRQWPGRIGLFADSSYMGLYEEGYVAMWATVTIGGSKQEGYVAVWATTVTWGFNNRSLLQCGQPLKRWTHKRAYKCCCN